MPCSYIIVIQGQLDQQWSAWLSDLMIHHLPGGQTVLSGPLADQSALYGVLLRLRDLGLPLVAVLVRPSE